MNHICDLHKILDPSDVFIVKMGSVFDLRANIALKDKAFYCHGGCRMKHYSLLTMYSFL